MVAEMLVRKLNRRRLKLEEGPPNMLMNTNSLSERPPWWFIDNGCTAVPDFNYGEVCRQHDFDYSPFSTETSRANADWRFKAGLIELGMSRPMSWVWWFGVRMLAGFAWKKATAENLMRWNRSQVTSIRKEKDDG